MKIYQNRKKNSHKILFLSVYGILFFALALACSDEPQPYPDFDNDVNESPFQEDKNDGDSNSNSDSDNDTDDFPDNPQEISFLDVIKGDSSDFSVPELNSPKLASLLADRVIFDGINKRYWKYNVVLPPSFYADVQKRYPVLYLLHGLGDNPNNSVSGLKVLEQLNYCYAKDLLPEIVVIIPDGEIYYWVDQYVDNVDYESFFFNIFLPEVESEFRILPNQKRFITGFSMGGYGSAHYAFSYPEKFGYCFAMSGSVIGKGVISTPSIPETIEKNQEETLPFITMDVGTGDQFLGANQNLDNYLTHSGINHEFICRDGGHNFDFWRQSFHACLLRLGRIMNNDKLYPKYFKTHED